VKSRNIPTGPIRLAAGGDEAVIEQLGGELVAWRVAGKSLLWTVDTAIWPRTSPILFPIVGRVRGGEIAIDGRRYPLGVHGFAAKAAFELVAEMGDEVRLRLIDNPETRAVFPFPFRLDVAYRLGVAQLAIDFVVTNTGHTPLPYALGWHPGFAWPFSAGGRDQYSIRFEQVEQPEVPIITADGLFSERRRPVPLDGRTLSLTNELLANEALCFLEAKSRSLRFAAPNGSAIHMELQDFPHIALWSRPPAPFFCIEAWTGHGDPDGFDGDICEKPSMRALPAGSEARHAVRLRYEAAE
jgi:galactose mutarotase-like enzyme